MGLSTIWPVGAAVLTLLYQRQTECGYNPTSSSSAWCSCSLPLISIHTGPSAVGSFQQFRHGFWPSAVGLSIGGLHSFRQLVSGTILQDPIADTCLSRQHTGPSAVGSFRTSGHGFWPSAVGLLCTNSGQVGQRGFSNLIINYLGVGTNTEIWFCTCWHLPLCVFQNLYNICSHNTFWGFGPFDNGGLINCSIPGSNHTLRAAYPVPSPDTPEVWGILDLSVLPCSYLSPFTA